MFYLESYTVLCILWYGGPMRGAGGGVLRSSSDGDDRMEAKIKTKKKSLGFSIKPTKIPVPEIYPPPRNSPMPNFQAFWILTTLVRPRTSSVLITLIRMTNLRLFWIRKKSARKSSHPKIYLPNFPNQKHLWTSWNQKFQTPKILRWSPPIELRSTPWPAQENSIFDFAKWRLDNRQFSC